MTYIHLISKLKVIFLLFALSALVSCGTQLRQNIDSNDEELWHRWGLSGKISIAVNASNQKANLLWESEGEDYQILLYGPLGQGKITIKKTGAQLSLSQGGEVHYANSPEELLLRSTGLELPISSLSFWVRGLPNPKWAANIKKGYDGKIENISQQGWNVRYANHYGANEWLAGDSRNNTEKRDIGESSITSNLFPSQAIHLPRKIILSKSNLPMGGAEKVAAGSPSQDKVPTQIKVVLVIKEWQP